FDKYRSLVKQTLEAKKQLKQSCSLQLLLCSFLLRFQASSEAGTYYKGCFLHFEHESALIRFAKEDSNMFLRSCIWACRDMKKLYFGVQETNCYCGDQIISEPILPSQCDRRCPGNNRETCGGSFGMSIYEVPPTTAVIVPAPSKGCYYFKKDKVLDFELEQNFAAMNQRMCAEGCLQWSYKYFGLAKGNECHCGNRILQGKAAPNRLCNARCKKGIENETCGGPKAMEVFDLLTTHI
ncbi:hypothetical protein BOX15_Mlig011934g1, partial [Macrostomum lignano]